ncbi:MAG: ThuA domain-containing protein [Eubacteriales bacterium]|nr:ThuA domain-containing protein [Eubacteriales bacterium]
MKKILVLCDDVWHPAEVVKRGMRPLAGQEYELDFVEDAKDILTPEMLEEYPLIICCKSNQLSAANVSPWFQEGITEVMAEDLRTYVERGGAFLSAHAGNAFTGEKKEEKAYLDLVGNRFVSHPPRCEVTLKKVKEHPILEGVAETFSVRDEHYRIEMLAEDAEVFLHSVSEAGGVQAAGYTRNIGKGRLCVLTPGHILAVWQNPEFGKMFRNAIKWCLGENAEG